MWYRLCNLFENIVNEKEEGSQVAGLALCQMDNQSVMLFSTPLQGLI